MPGLTDFQLLGIHPGKFPQQCAVFTQDCSGLRLCNEATCCFFLQQLRSSWDFCYTTVCHFHQLFSEGLRFSSWPCMSDTLQCSCLGLHISFNTDHILLDVTSLQPAPIKCFHLQSVSFLSIPDSSIMNVVFVEGLGTTSVK